MIRTVPAEPMTVSMFRRGMSSGSSFDPPHGELDELITAPRDVTGKFIIGADLAGGARAQRGHYGATACRTNVHFFKFLHSLSSSLAVSHARSGSNTMLAKFCDASSSSK